MALYLFRRFKGTDAEPKGLSTRLLLHDLGRSSQIVLPQLLPYKLPMINHLRRPVSGSPLIGG